MAIKCETGTWTASGSSPQTITLADGSFGTPTALVVWMTGAQGAPSAGSFASGAILAMGFATRRGGSTQQGGITSWQADNVSTSDTQANYVDTAMFQVLSNGAGSLDYSVSLSSFGDAQFTVTYSSASNASGDFFQYWVISGLTDANVLSWTMDSTGATEVITGVGFQPTAMLCLDASGTSSGTLVGQAIGAFGCATSSSRFWCMSFGASDGDTMTSTMNNTRAFRTDACLERLAINSDSADARWDLDSFDADGCTLGVIDAPGTTTREAIFLFLQGGQWEAGSQAKATGTGNDTFTLATSTLTPISVLLGMTNQTAVGISAGNATMCLGAGSTPSTTRGSAVNNCVGITGPEAINTTVDRFRATDSIIEELTGGSTPAETSEAWFDSVALGSFTLDWATNGGSAALIGYLVVGDEVAQTPAPKNRVLSQARQRAVLRLGR